MNSSVIPRIPNPTTLIPMTEPPLNATIRALFKLSRAACVVRVFAAVATRIPKKPASPLQSAPIKNDRPTRLVPCEAFPHTSNAATAKTKIAKTLYSRVKNAMAPSRTA